MYQSNREKVARPHRSRRHRAQQEGLDMAIATNQIAKSEFGFGKLTGAANFENCRLRDDRIRGRDQRSQRKTLGYAWLCERLGLVLSGSREDRCRSACAISGFVTGSVGAWTARNVGYWRQVGTVLTLTNRTTPGGDVPRSPE
jgi:hypothetical protein